MWIYHREYIFLKLPGAASLPIVADLDALYDGFLENGNWAVAILKSTLDSAVADRAGEIRKCFGCFQNGLAMLVRRLRRFY